ncbi:hypothetical protein P4O66_009287 [Electrophorus voltai]|uniref:Uncharacterized protein n=1 Tax=Electrophorus voltai TaxID=2609070 RepID=A0AAD9DW67_9TELE|nr:hypothetical protein P4O66_009287 [Electrophorus voltai]
MPRTAPAQACVRPSEPIKTQTYQGCLGKEKGKKGSQCTPTSHAARSPVVVGTLLTPGADLSTEAGEVYGTPAGDLDWYNDFQYSESDSVDSYCPAGRPSLILASLQETTGREESTEQFWGGTVYGPGLDIAECYGEQPDQEDRYSEMDSARSYDPCLDVHRGYTDYGETEECSDVCLWSERGSNHEEEAPIEVEEDPHRDVSSHGEAKSSQSNEPPAPKEPPRARRSACEQANPSLRAGSVCVPVSVIILVPVLPPATLFALARGRLSGPPSPFGVGLRAAARGTLLTIGGSSFWLLGDSDVVRIQCVGCGQERRKRGYDRKIGGGGANLHQNQRSPSTPSKIALRGDKTDHAEVRNDPVTSHVC